MTEKVVIGNAELWHGDCRKLMHLADRANALVTDPPYGIAYKHSGKEPNRQIQATTNTEAIIGDDTEFDPSFLIEAFDGAYIGNKSNGKPVVIFGANHFCNHIPHHGQWLVWDKSCGQGAAANFADAEFMWTNRKTARCIFRLIWQGAIRGGSGAPINGKRLHVSQKPVELMAWCLDAARVGLGKTVLDPFMGSGSTGIACLRTGRKFIGVEIDRKHFEAACRRIEDETRQQSFDLSA